MTFTTETSRSEAIQPLEKAKSVFADHLHGRSDAVFFSLDKTHVFAVTGMPMGMPAGRKLLADPEIGIYLKSLSSDVLYDTEGTLIVNTKETAFPKELKKKADEILHRLYKAPGRLNGNGELEIDLLCDPIGTHYPVNLLLGNREESDDCLQSTPKSVLDHFGRGSFRGRQEKQVLATRYVLSPEETGEPYNRQFYITEHGKQIFCSFDIHHNVKEAVCVHSQNRTVITYHTECGLKITRTIFILPHEEGMPSAVEAQKIHIENERDTKRDLRIVVTGMFGITDPGTLSGDIIYANVVVESELCCIDGKPVAMAAHHQPKECLKEKRFAMLLVNGEPMEECCSYLPDFLGSGTPEYPEGLSSLSNLHTRRQAAFFAMGRSFTLDKEISVSSFAGITDGQEDVTELFPEELLRLYERYRDPSALDHTLDRIVHEEDRYASALSVQSGDEHLDAYLSKNLPFQVLYQTYVSRSFAWTQKSYRETGFREIQDIYASMYYLHAEGKDELIRKLLSSWIVNVFSFGYAYHNFTSRGKEPGMCSDDQLWLVQAVYRYVMLTGDRDFLFREFDIAGSTEKRSLRDTLIAILRYSGKISVGKHGLPLLDKADWNDCLRLDHGVLDGPEKEAAYYKQLKKNGQDFGVPFENTQSESVMNACLLKIAADECIELAELLSDEEFKDFAKLIADDVRDSVRRNAWIEGYYARCLLNDGRPYSYLGSAKDGLSLDPSIDGTYYLNSFSWTLLSKIADEEQIREMLKKVEKHLKCDAGLKLVTAVDYDKLGITTGSSFYFPGDRENGGVFKHAAMMATVACLKEARTLEDHELAEKLRDLAFFMIGKTLPYKTLEDPYRLKGNPRFCTQYNNSITGEGIGPILSGTASWLTLALYEILGIDLQGDRLYLSPVLDREKIAYTLKIRETLFDITVKAVHDFRVSDTTVFMYDGKKTSAPVRLCFDGKQHVIEVIL